MLRLSTLSALVILGVSAPASAQFFRPHIVVYGPAFGYGPPLGYGWGGGVWVVPPPVVIVRPPVVVRPPRDDRPEAEAVRPTPALEKAVAEAKVNAEVAKGNLLVVRPGQPVARIVPPPDRIEKADPIPAAKPPGVSLEPQKLPADPKARAAFRVAGGRAAFEAEKFGLAVDRFREATQADPRDAFTYFLLAQAHTARGEYAEAVVAIREGMQLAPGWPNARFRIVDLYGEHREWLADHLTALRTASERPNEPAARFLYAYHLWFAGERPAALKVFRELSPTVKDNAIIERFIQVADGKDI